MTTFTQRTRPTSNVIHFDGVGSVTVLKETDIRTGDWKPARVNWCAVGFVTVEQAREFMNTISHALSLARLLEDTPLMEFSEARKVD